GRLGGRDPASDRRVVAFHGRPAFVVVRRGATTGGRDARDGSPRRPPGWPRRPMEDLAGDRARPRVPAEPNPATSNVRFTGSPRASVVARVSARLPPFEAFLESTRTVVYRYLVAAVGPVDADDVFQETFLAAL